MTNHRFDFIVTLAVILLGVLFLVLAFQIDTPSRLSAAEALVGPPMVPIIISLLIITLGLLELAAVFMSVRSNETPESTEDSEEFEPFSRALVTRLALTVVIGFAYVWLLGAVGYLIASACALIALLVLFGTRSPVKILLISVIGAALYYFFFIRLMGVYDPAGWLISFS